MGDVLDVLGEFPQLEKEARMMGIEKKLMPKRRNHRWELRKGYCQRCDISLTGRFAHVPAHNERPEIVASETHCGPCILELEKGKS